MVPEGSKQKHTEKYELTAEKNGLVNVRSQPQTRVIRKRPGPQQKRSILTPKNRSGAKYTSPEGAL